MITGDDRDPTANLGTKSGDFNLGTSGKGMPSNPKGRLKVDRSTNSGLGRRVNRRGRKSNGIFQLSTKSRSQNVYI